MNSPEKPHKTGVTTLS